ncbi:hypothetical protein C5S32_10295 [ANME-1 cluster archaeon GoMg1]|nr:hypothetical protein [ANME-1 cluster archaeon GoMg1]
MVTAQRLLSEFGNFKEAISASASSCIFIHNHPSGDPTPSVDENELGVVIL